MQLTYLGLFQLNQMFIELSYHHFETSMSLPLKITEGGMR